MKRRKQSKKKNTANSFAKQTTVGKTKELNSPQSETEESKVHGGEERKSYKMDKMVMIINTIVSVAALAVSIFAVYFSVLYNEKSSDYDRKEYEYKVEPEIRISYIPEELQVSSDGKASFSFKQILIDILEQNNLKQIYMIRADGEVEKVASENLEDSVKADINHGIQEENSEIVVDQYKYWYEFLCLESLDGEYILYLLYTKKYDEFMQLNAVSGVEIYGLKNSHQDERAYEGEKIMARRYIEIMKELSQYAE